MLGHGRGGCDVVIVGGFVVGGGGVRVSAFEELAVESPVVVPVDVFEGGELDVATSSQPATDSAPNDPPDAPTS